MTLLRVPVVLATSADPERLAPGPRGLRAACRLARFSRSLASVVGPSYSPVCAKWRE